MLVCLLEDKELVSLQISGLIEEAEARGLETHRLPIPDGGVLPNTLGVEKIVALIISRATAGKNVVIHCMGGLGRAGTIGGCYLRACGMGSEQALKLLVATRGRSCPETEEQRQFIRSFR